MKNILQITTEGEQLVSSINDGTNRLFINDSEVAQSLWIGTGNYTRTVNGHYIRIARIESADGNIMIQRLSEYNYSLVAQAEDLIDYETRVANKPTINSVELSGNKSSEDIKVVDYTDPRYTINTSAASTTDDGALYSAINTLGWVSAVISSGKLGIKKLLSRILNNQDFTPITRSWSAAISGSTGSWQELTRITIPSNSQYLILANNANNIGNSAYNNIRFRGTSDLFSRFVGSNSGNGNWAFAWGYAWTQNQSQTIVVETYKYPVSETPIYEGEVIAIPLRNN